MEGAPIRWSNRAQLVSLKQITCHWGNRVKDWQVPFKRSCSHIINIWACFDFFLHQDFQKQWQIYDLAFLDPAVLDTRTQEGLAVGQGQVNEMSLFCLVK